MLDGGVPPPVDGTLRDRIARRFLSAAVGASLLASPRPAALLVRRRFAATGALMAQDLERHAGPGVVALTDERYGEEPDMLLDLYRPAGLSDSLPLLVWVHGGAFIGGAKEEVAGYLKLLAAGGHVVAAPRYSLAPEHRYPAPPRQVLRAVEHLQASAGRLGVDPGRIAIAGDSAGAHIAAQVAALVTTPGYADAVGVAPTIAPGQLRALVLACGPYDLGLARQVTSAAGRRFMQIVLWAYSGRRRFLDDPAFAAWSVADNVSSAFPPVLLTAGNADPLAPHSRLLAERLHDLGVEVETLFFPDDHDPPLGHEYQFELDTDAARGFLERLLAFLRQRLGR